MDVLRGKDESNYIVTFSLFQHVGGEDLDEYLELKNSYYRSKSYSSTCLRLACQVRNAEKEAEPKC